MLVLSAAVLVIVIDARDVGPLVVHGARGFNTKNTELTKVFWEWLCARGVATE